MATITKFESQLADKSHNPLIGQAQATIPVVVDSLDGAALTGNTLTTSGTPTVDELEACVGVLGGKVATRECVIAIPTLDMLDTMVGIGTCSGADTDKFAKFKLTALPGRRVKAPLIKECLANVECRVAEIIKKHDIVVLEGVAAYEDSSRRERRTVHAVGDWTFVVDGRRLSRRRRMAAKIPVGV